MVLLLAFPRDKGITKKHTPASSRSPGVWATSPISVTIGLKLKRRTCREEQATTRCAKNIANDAANGREMVMPRGLHELADSVNSIRDVWSGDG